MIPRPERLSIEGPAGALQAIVEEPAADVAGAFAVVCHPHPLYGGTMDNKVVTTVARALNEESITTVRFNFRGVGSSEGAFDQGRGETDDAAAIRAWGEHRWPGRPLLLAGFSFGGVVALELARRRTPQVLIAVAPAIQYLSIRDGWSPECPCTVIQGEADDVVEPEAVTAWVERLDPKPRLVLLPGVGHFFHGRLADLKDAVRGAVRSG
jgi:alpha/beta superfamily hydrolase